MEGQHGVTGGVDPEQRSGPYQHFYILNENVFELILSFLSNQALTKLHVITGDNYPNCEPHLAPFCCECGNDNPKMFDGICRECESKVDGYTPFIQKETATSRYGLKIRDLVDIPQYPRDGHQDATLYHRVDLENYLIAKCGSKMTWLREIARRFMVESAIEAMQEQEREERQVFMESLAPGFVIYAQLIDLEETNKSLLWQCSQHFTALTTELKSRGFQLRPESKLCEQFVVSGDGAISHVVDTLEERRFLDGCTDYSRLWQRKFENAQHGNETKHGFREEAKMELCIAYLENHRGLKLPRKWENCRSRFEKSSAYRRYPSVRGALHLQRVVRKIPVLETITTACTGSHFEKARNGSVLAGAIYLLEEVGPLNCITVVPSTCNAYERRMRRRRCQFDVLAGG